MTALHDLRTVIELACLIEDRSDQEQKALLRIAVRADKDANRMTVTNKRAGGAWRLAAMVDRTRVLGPDDKPVTVISRNERARLENKAAQWDQFHVEWQAGKYTDDIAPGRRIDTPV